jgi:hypothetical protein
MEQERTMSIAQRLRQRPRRVQRALALLLLPMLLMLGWSALAVPVWQLYQAQQHWRAHALRTLAHRHALAASEPLLRAELLRLPRSRDWLRLYQVRAKGLAVSALRAEVGTILNSLQARTQALSPLAQLDAGEVRKVGLRIVAAMRIDQLQQFLVQVQALTHLVRVEQLQISAPPTQAAQENPLLTVTMDICGFEVDASDSAMATTGGS